MINSKKNDALGIIFPNSYDSLVPELVTERTMASIPFASRYRLVDFLISSMVHSGITNISLLVRQNYHSLMDHLGSGREWDLARKKGGINIFPPYAQKSVKVFNGWIEGLESIKGFLNSQTEKYVVLADSNFAINFDFTKLIEAHIQSGADATAVYRKSEVPEIFRGFHSNNHDYYYSYCMNEEGRITKIDINSTQPGVVNFGMNIYVVERERLIDMIDEAYIHGYTYFMRDLLAPNVNKMKIQGYCYEGYVAHIHDMKSYFEENMKLMHEENLQALFAGEPIYTKIRDDNPTRYLQGSKAKNVLVADGCVIEGEVENCVLFRGVHIGKGAKVRNCVLMQDTVIEENCDVQYVITDKNVRITAGKYLSGNDSYQVFVAKHQTV
ncbi:MAG: glucose-1-phosphate adenylyltransferase subunit GlgD [Lachnospiraceae bacterium]|nr:glucose-1-phosphate adenylyltransferase subunit GlgD [Lachnospiraceae bacterium]